MSEYPQAYSDEELLFVEVGKFASARAKKVAEIAYLTIQCCVARECESGVTVDPAHRDSTRSRVCEIIAFMDRNLVHFGGVCPRRLAASQFAHMYGVSMVQYEWAFRADYLVSVCVDQVPLVVDEAALVEELAAAMG